MAGRTITQGYYKLRMKIFERDNFTCKMCGQSAPNVKLELDHIIPIAEGGTDNEENLRTSCYACNRGRAGLIPKTITGGSAKHSPRSKNRPELIAECIYKILLKWDGGFSAYDISSSLIKGITKEEAEKALILLWERNMAYRYRGMSGVWEWQPIDKYSSPKGIKESKAFWAMK